MSIKYMTVSLESNEIKGSTIYEYSEIANNGDVILLPDKAGKVDSILVMLKLTNGSGYVQTTNSKRSDVLANRAEWITWSKGIINSTDEITFYPVSGIKVIVLSGTAEIIVRAV